MPKKILNSNIKNEDSPLSGKVSSPPSPKPSSELSVKKTAELSDKVLFEPTAPQRKVKARFWTKFQAGPFADPTNIPMSIALEVTGSAAIRKWWAVSGFREWFLNKEEERERIKYLFNKSLDTAETILDNPEANANAKANIIKMLAEMNGYLGKKPAEKFADDEINKMSESQLQTFLEKKGVKVVQEKLIDVRPKEEEK